MSNSKKLYEKFKETDLFKTSTDCQKKFYEAYFEERNIFISGPAGTGKSYALKGLMDFLSKNGVNVAITATTGVAAYNVGGQTIHSWAGIGLGDLQLDDLIDKVNRNKVAHNRIVETDVLVIDEVSMLKSDLINKLNGLFQSIRFSKEPFGGMQIVYCGDMLQLPPVWKNGEDEEFVFESESWKNSNPKIVYLKEIIRQINDKRFATLLNELRVGCLDNFHILKERVDGQFPDDGIDPVFLYCKNADVEILNKEMLKEVDGDVKRFYAKDTGSPYHTEFFNKHTPIPEILELKIGAQVMLLRNIDVPNGLVNGSIGKVTGYTSDGNVKVKFKTGEHIITNYSVELREQKPSKGKLTMEVVASRTQIPLRIAYAVTIHRIQGSTLDRAVIDLSEAFADGMCYVALSRVRDLEAMSLTEFKHHRVRVNQKCLDFYKEIEENESTSKN
jgi:ATP-dependent exoDNAse (exonuclease V) alpha subunit